MADPTDALVSFQQEFLSARFRKELLRGEIDPALFVHYDRPAGEPRFTYVKAENGKVAAMAIFVKADPVDGTPCFGVGVAVAEAHRGKGLAKKIVEAAIAEMKNGMARNGLKTFYVEAIVGMHNTASQRVADKVISDKPVATTDAASGLSALQYLREVS